MRRLFVEHLRPGPVELDESQSRHARAALRLNPGDAVELITAGGVAGTGKVVALDPRVTVDVETVIAATPNFELRVASAVPKGDRADWLVEKLSEIGVAAWTPLRTARSVVHPDGEAKFDRWRRIAVEAAKQSKRPGVMRIEPLATLGDFVRSSTAADSVYLGTGDPRTRLHEVRPRDHTLTLLIGPEGGWTDDEERLMDGLRLTRAALGPTVLRVETAAVVAAGILSVTTLRNP